MALSPTSFLHFSDKRIEKALPWIVLLLALIVKFSYWAVTGIRFGGDSNFYLTITRSFLHLTSGLAPYPIYYNGYPFFMAIISKIVGFSNLIPVVIGTQIILSAISCVFLFQTCKLLSANRIISFGLSALYICNFEVLNWDRYILTDSFNLSLVIIMIYMILRWTRLKNKFCLFALWIPFLLITLFFTRPTNLVLISLTIVFVLIQAFSPSLKTLTISTFFLCVGLVVLWFPVSQTQFYKGMSDFSTKNLIRGEVINDSPDQDINQNFQWETASKLKKATFISKVFLKRTVYFWTISLDRYSLSHKILNWVWLFPFFLAGWISMIALWLKARSVETFYITVMILAYVVFQSLMIIDFDFRYRIMVMPFLVLAIAKASKNY